MPITDMLFVIYTLSYGTFKVTEKTIKNCYCVFKNIIKNAFNTAIVRIRFIRKYMQR